MNKNGRLPQLWLIVSLMLLVSMGDVSTVSAVGVSEQNDTVAAGTDKSATTDATSAASSEYGPFPLEWTAQPPLGMITGDYYRVEERFRQGHQCGDGGTADAEGTAHHR